MTDFYKRISTIVDSQLPDFVRENNETFVAFLKAYYEYLEQDGKAQSIIQNARDYGDVDKTIDSFVDYFVKEFAYGIPEYVFKVKLSDNVVEQDVKRFLIKYIKGLYRSKGSPNALRFLFRLAFDEEIELYYPSEYLLRPSDGKFNRYAIARVQVTPGTNLAVLLNKEIRGDTSGLITSFDSVFAQNETFYDLFLDEQQFLDNDLQFLSGEKIVPVDPTLNPGGDIIVRPILAGININDPGTAYFNTDNIVIIPKGDGYFKGSELNLYWNPTLKGASETSNTLPTNWNYSAAGIQYKVQGTGSDDTVDYVDIKFEGTKTAGNTWLYFDDFVKVPALKGNIFTHSMYVSVVGGSTTNLTGGNASLIVAEYDSSNAYLGASTLSFNPSNTTGERYLSKRVKLTRTMQSNSAAYVRGILALPVATSSSINVTLRIGGVQIEQSANASPSWISPDIYVKTDSAPPVPTAIIDGLTETGQITSIGINARGANLTPNTSVFVGTHTGNLNAKYTLSNGIVTITTLTSNAAIATNHGVEPEDLIEFVTQSGELISGTYVATEPLSLKTFKAVLNEDTTLGVLRNNLKYSEDFSNVYWTKANVTVLANQTLSPTGALTADKIVPNSNVATHFITTTDFSLSGNDTFTIYAKAAELPRLAIARSGSIADSAIFNLQWGFVEVVETKKTLSTYEETDNFIAAMEDSGDGWYRCRLTLKAGSAKTGQYLFAPTKTTSFSYAGNNVDGLYIWGAHENSNPTPSTYIATTNTRAYLVNYNENNFYFTDNLAANVGIETDIWTRTGLANVIAGFAGPTGELTAFKLIENTGTSAHRLSQARPLQSNVEYVISVYAKAGERGNLRIEGNTSGMFSTTSYADFNLSDGTVTRIAGGIENANIALISNGWYRLSASGRKTGTGTALVNFYVKPDSTTTTSYTGNGSNGLLLAKPQLSVGSVLKNYVANLSNISVSYSKDVLAGTGKVYYKREANLSPIISTIARGAFGYPLTQQDGQLSSQMRIQDSYKWQQFSYVIRTALSLDLWKDLVKQVLHPAGLILFNETVVYTVVEGEQVAIKVKPQTNPYDAFVTLLMVLSETPSVSVKSKLAQLEQYFEVLVDIDPMDINITNSVYSIGATARTPFTFNLAYGYEFPINIVSSYKIEDLADLGTPELLNLKSRFQPPSYREYPAREVATANTIYSIRTATNANAAIVYGTHPPRNTFN